jgi:hypothetical protein
VVLVKLREFEAHGWVVHLGGEGLEVHQGLSAITASLGDFTVGTVSVWPRAALKSDGRGPLRFIEGPRSLQGAREPDQISLVQ